MSRSLPPSGRIWSGAAPAKVNLFLRILAREEGGYHQIETLFQALELSDRVELRVSEDQASPRDGARPTGEEAEAVTLILKGVEEGALGSPDSNLAVRAARAFLDEAPFDGPGGPPSVAIHLEKRIPHGAGLGGGSSDAAAVLRGLGDLYPHAMAPERLHALAGGLGADVPFFLGGGPLALGWGRGDRLLPLPPLPSRPVILLIPDAPIATPWAYQVLAARRRARGESGARARVLGSELLESGTEEEGPSPGTAAHGATGGPSRSRWDQVAASAENAFQAALEPHRPELERLRRGLAAAGAGPALLSGSGSSLFGVFESPSRAERAEAELAQRFPEVRRIRTRTLGTL